MCTCVQLYGWGLGPLDQNSRGRKSPTRTVIVSSKWSIGGLWARISLFTVVAASKSCNLRRSTAYRVLPDASRGPWDGRRNRVPGQGWDNVGRISGRFCLWALELPPMWSIVNWSMRLPARAASQNGSTYLGDGAAAVDSRWLSLLVPSCVT